jgi:hypothetical protein
MRPSRPWFRASNNAWYVEVSGSQRSLGQHPHGYPKPKKSEKTALWNVPEPIRDALLKAEPAEAGFDSHLTKPADPDALHRLLGVVR